MRGGGGAEKGEALLLGAGGSVPLPPAPKGSHGEPPPRLPAAGLPFQKKKAPQGLHQSCTCWRRPSRGAAASMARAVSLLRLVSSKEAYPYTLQQSGWVALLLR